MLNFSTWASIVSLSAGYACQLSIPYLLLNSLTRQHVNQYVHIQMLRSHYFTDLIEAGCDEAGRGCLAGSVFAAAVILPTDYENALLNDSKKLTEKQRYALRTQIEADALAWAVGEVTADEIDEINILNASLLAMHRALDGLKLRPQAVIVDGNRFKPYGTLPHETIVKGDAKYLSIAAASILAKTYRDDYMDNLALQYPAYQWKVNKGYPTKAHRAAIEEHGISPFHRKTFKGVKEMLEVDEGSV